MEVINFKIDDVMS